MYRFLCSDTECRTRCIASLSDKYVINNEKSGFGSLRIGFWIWRAIYRLANMIYVEYSVPTHPVLCLFVFAI